MEFQEGFNNKHYKSKTNNLYSFDLQNHKKQKISRTFQDILIGLTQISINKTQSLRYAKTSKTFRSSSQQQNTEISNKNLDIYKNENSFRINQSLNLRKDKTRSFSLLYSQLNPQVIKKRNLYQNDCLASTKLQNKKQQKVKQKHSLIELLRKNSLKQNNQNNFIQKAKQKQKICQKYSSQRKNFQFLIKKEKYLITQEKQPSNKTSESDRNHILSGRCHRNRQLKFDSNKDKISPWINYEETY